LTRGFACFRSELDLSPISGRIEIRRIAKGAQKETIVPHAALALYILAFSLGIGVIGMGALTFRRLRVGFYATFTLLFTGSTILLLREGVSTYDKVTGGVLGPAVGTVLLWLSVVGNGLLAYSLPVLSMRLISVRIKDWRAVAHVLIVVALVVFGGLKELVAGSWTDILNYFGLTALYAYGTTVLFLGLNRIEAASLRRLVRRFLLLAVVLMLPGFAQIALKYLPGSPAPFREYPFVQVVYYLASIGLLLAYALRPTAEAIGSPGCALPVSFVQRYNISPRECEIITMLERGYSNSTLAEALFISTRTVKNHVYHIYQKTGAKNKVQLINQVRTLDS
jgi:DNA-binding CsgD family transcriptional regulator